MSDQPRRNTRVLIVDDQMLFAEGLRFVIESRAPDFEVVDIAGDGRAAVAKARAHRPDIILMDVRMPDMDGVEATRIIHDRFPDTKVLILTTFDDDEYVKQSMLQGAVGYILKNRPPAELIDAIRALRDGFVQIDPAVSAKLFEGSGRAAGGDPQITARLRTLTSREREVLRRLVRAERISQIGASLGIAEQTVRNHIGNIYSKLQIHTRIEIVRYITEIRSFLEHEA
jgi:DNA-binding NarL/FixJ family response regulator